MSSRKSQNQSLHKSIFNPFLTCCHGYSNNMATTYETEPVEEPVKAADISATCDESIDIKYWWHVNKSGFPICEETWEKMWTYVAAVHPEGNELTQAIQSSPAKKVKDSFVALILIEISFLIKALHSCCTLPRCHFYTS